MNCEYCKQENMTTIARRNEICPVCEENARRVRELEGEVERLKGEWKRVKDGLPKVAGKYLITLIGGDVDIDNFHPQAGWHSYGVTRYANTSGRIIAWKQHPAPYKPEAEEVK